MKTQLRKIDIKAPFEIREDGEKKTIVGIIPFNSRSADLGWFTEVITETAFDKTMADGADVKALYCHDSGKVLGRTKNGTLRLSVGMMGEVKGLVCECDLADTTYSRDAYALIKRGDVNTMSFGFYPVKERVEIEDEKEVRYLLEVKLLEVSFAVPFPAYEETNSEAREIRGIKIDALADILAKPELSTEDKEVLGNINSQIRAVLEPSQSPDTEAVPDTSAADFLVSLLTAAKRKEK